MNGTNRLAAELSLLTAAIAGGLSATEGASLTGGLEAALWSGAAAYLGGLVAGAIVGRIAEERAMQIEEEAFARRQSDDAATEA